MSATPPPPDSPPTEDDPGTPEFGPSGYLPQRAAQRARKIVLREQMGLHWTVAAVIAGVLILAVTVPLVLGGSGAPGPPFVDAGPLEQVDPRGDALLDVDGVDVLVVRGGGVLTAFVDPADGARYCPTSRRIEAPDGTVWSLQGNRVGGDGQPLVSAGVVAVEDRLYLDLDNAVPGRVGGGTPIAPQC